MAFHKNIAKHGGGGGYFLRNTGKYENLGQDDRYHPFVLFLS